jgi:hypothetical protein
MPQRQLKLLGVNKPLTGSSNYFQRGKLSKRERWIQTVTDAQ